MRRCHADRHRHHASNGSGRLKKQALNSRPVAIGHRQTFGLLRANKENMKQKIDERNRTYAIVSTGEASQPADTAGQSGDTQGLSDVAEAGSESVAELIEEGQSFEAEAIGGVEDAPDADVAEVHTRQFPEDDVPAEYLGRD